MTSVAMNEPRRSRLTRVARGVLLVLAVVLALFVIWVAIGLTTGTGDEGESGPLPSQSR